MAVIKGISNFGTPYYTDEPRYERKNGQWIDTKADIITELEKTKKKIKNDIILHEEWFVGIDDLEKCLGRIDAIVDREIAELKGENNETCN